MSETVSTRLTPELIRLLEEEAREKGISMAELLREALYEHLGKRRPEQKESAETEPTPTFYHAITLLGRIKEKGCPYIDEDGLCTQITLTEEQLKALDLNPHEPLMKAKKQGEETTYHLKPTTSLCALCQVHWHQYTVFPPSVNPYNPYEARP